MLKMKYSGMDTLSIKKLLRKKRYIPVLVDREQYGTVEKVTDTYVGVEPEATTTGTILLKEYMDLTPLVIKFNKSKDYAVVEYDEI